MERRDVLKAGLVVGGGVVLCKCTSNIAQVAGGLTFAGEYLKEGVDVDTALRKALKKQKDWEVLVDVLGEGQDGRDQGRTGGGSSGPFQLPKGSNPTQVWRDHCRGKVTLSEYRRTNDLQPEGSKDARKLQPGHSLSCE